MTKTLFARLAGALACVAFTLTVCGTAAAGEKETPKQIYQRAVKAYEGGRFEEAAEAFRDAYDAKPSWKLLFNIAQSEAAARRYDLALEAFEAYLAEGGDELSEKKEMFIYDEIEKLKKKVGTLDVDIPDGATVVVDGVERGTAPLPGRIRVVAGKLLSLEVKDGDNVLLSREVKVGSGESLHVGLEPLPEQENPAPAAEEEPMPEPQAVKTKADGRPLKVSGWVLVGTGGALGVVGAITGAATMSKADTIDKRCPDGMCTDPADLDLLDEGQTLGTVTNVMLISGGVLAATGLVLLIVGMKKDKEAPVDAQSARVRFRPLSLGLEGSF